MYIHSKSRVSFSSIIHPSFRQGRKSGPFQLFEHECAGFSSLDYNQKKNIQFLGCIFFLREGWTIKTNVTENNNILDLSRHGIIRKSGILESAALNTIYSGKKPNYVRHVMITLFPLSQIQNLHITAEY